MIVYMGFLLKEKSKKKKKKTLQDGCACLL